MKIYQHYATDEQAEIDGVWVELGEGARIKVARVGNPSYEKVLRQLKKPYRNITRAGGEIPREALDKITIEATAEALLLDWQGLDDEDGTAIPYSKEAAKRLLGELKDFRETVVRLALEAETFRAEALEAAAKNSESSPAGRASTAAKKSDASSTS
jgi:hypothetical protein